MLSGTKNSRSCRADSCAETICCLFCTEIDEFFSQLSLFPSSPSTEGEFGWAGACETLLFLYIGKYFYFLLSFLNLLFTVFHFPQLFAVLLLSFKKKKKSPSCSLGIHHPLYRLSQPLPLKSRHAYFSVARRIQERGRSRQVILMARTRNIVRNDKDNFL